MSRKYIHTLAIALLAALLSACQYKPLSMNATKSQEVDVNFVWMERSIPEVEKISTYFYEKNSREQICFELSGVNGGAVKLYEGEYMSLAVNSDTPSVMFRDDDYPEAFAAYTRSVSLEAGTQIFSKAPMPKAAGTESQQVTLAPDVLYGGIGTGLILPDDSGRPREEIPMRRLTSHITVSIENVPNLQYSGQFGASLSGLASSLYVADALPSGNPVIHSFPLQVIEGSTLYAELNCFGICPYNEDCSRHVLTVYAVLADGKAWYCSVDVTDQLHDEELNPDPNNVVIILDGLPLPQPVSDGSGFVPDVDGWNGVEITLGM